MCEINKLASCFHQTEVSSLRYTSGGPVSLLIAVMKYRYKVQGVYFYENFRVPLQDSQVFTHLPPKSQILAELEQNTEREYMLGTILVTVLSVLFFSLFIKYLKLCIFCQYEILP